jgi:hypothetical protein
MPSDVIGSKVGHSAHKPRSGIVRNNRKDFAAGSKVWRWCRIKNNPPPRRERNAEAGPAAAAAAAAVAERRTRVSRVSEMQTPDTGYPAEESGRKPYGRSLHTSSLVVPSSHT